MVAVLAFVASLGSSRTAHAQSAPELPIAQALFEEARVLMAAGRYDEACAKLGESQRLDRASGTLLNLAVCHERQGKTATAWAEYNDVVAGARSEGNSDRQRIAEQQIRELEPRLCHLSIVSGGATEVGALAVTIDGLQLTAAAWGAAIPLDPGAHEVSVALKGKKPWTGKVTLAGDHASTVLTVLFPEDAPLRLEPALIWVSERQRIGACETSTALQVCATSRQLRLRHRLAVWLSLPMSRLA